MSCVIVYPDPNDPYDCWLVTLPDLPSGTIWSRHDTKHAAEIEAQDVAEAMAYDGVEVRS